MEQWPQRAELETLKRKLQSTAKMKVICAKAGVCVPGGGE